MSSILREGPGDPVESLHTMKIRDLLNRVRNLGKTVPLQPDSFCIFVECIIFDRVEMNEGTAVRILPILENFTMTPGFVCVTDGGLRGQSGAETAT